ncbi:hypothetical protein HC928_13565 [bacterium]|nr:hypothetical protein [bacterium]
MDDLKGALRDYAAMFKVFDRKYQGAIQVERPPLELIEAVEVVQTVQAVQDTEAILQVE